MPVGEVGKQLQLTTNNVLLPQLIKTQFGGLKAFLDGHPKDIVIGKDHPFNPSVYLAGDPRAFEEPSTQESGQKRTGKQSDKDRKKSDDRLGTAGESNSKRRRRRRRERGQSQGTNKDYMGL